MLHIEVTLLVGLQIGPVFIGRTLKMDGGFYGATGRVGEAQAQFTAVALAKEGQRAEEEERCKSPDQIGLSGLAVVLGSFVICTQAYLDFT